MRRNMRSAFVRALIPLLPLVGLVNAFYLPGVAPTSYKEGDQASQSLRDDQVHSAISWDYYTDEFHFCKPENGPKSISESLGSILFGDRIQTSPFDLRMAVNQTCRVIPNCPPQNFSPEEAKFVNERISQSYNLNWLVDGFPAAQLYTDTTTDEVFYSPGFALGYLVNDRPVLNNHFDIIVEYHQASSNQFRIVGVEVEPQSNRATKDNGDGTADCQFAREDQDIVLDEERGSTGVLWTYSVYWRPSDTPFATRWDKYLLVQNAKIHWLVLINSAIVVVFFSVLVALILVRALRRDITRYNRLDQFVLDDMVGTNGQDPEIEDGVQEDSGWKLVHGDVFRPPKMPLVLSVLVGNGLQLFMMTGFTILFALLGFLSPSNRGSLGSVMILLYTIFGSISGFASSYTYKCLGGEDRWKQNILLTPVALPVVVFSVFFLLNLFLWAKGSSGAVPFTTMLVIVLIWFVISLPLSFAGSWLAFKRPKLEAPTKTNQIPRQIPEHRGSGIMGFLDRPIPAILLAGIFPFGAIFMELYFIMNSLWSAKFYYMFGFLFVCFGLMVVTCATVTVLSVYFVLCSENYHWQWRAFFTSGSCAAWIFLNSIVFWFTRLSFQSWTSSVLYFGYSALISLLVFIMTGTIGFVSSLLFVHRIYRSIKVD